MQAGGIVEDLDWRFLPRLEAEADRLRREFPQHTFWTGSRSSGPRTGLPFSFHSVYIDCMIPDVDDRTRPDDLCLEIRARHIATEPLLDTADVCWGHPSGHLEIDLLPKPVPADGEHLDRIESQLPALLAALRRALERGRPDAPNLFPF
jgi:hypothetical protein